MNSISLTIIVGPLLATFFYPSAFRHRETGEFLGFVNLYAAAYFLLHFAADYILISNTDDPNVGAFEDAMFGALLVYICGIAYTFLTHKENYGVSLDVTKRKSKDTD